MIPALHGILASLSTGINTDPSFPSVVLLLNPNNTNGSTTFTDLSPTTQHTLSAVGNAQHSTNQTIYGSTSILVDGSGDAITAPNNADFRLNGDSTVELWVYPLALTAERYFLSHYDYGAGQRDWRFGLAPSTANLIFDFVSANGSTTTSLNAGESLTINTWQHIAVTRSGSTARIFIQGVQKATNTTLADQGGSTASLSIGSLLNSGSPAFGANCHIGPIRITKGVARYTGNFTVPSAAFPDS
jgi:hypothetical protein